MLSGCTGASSPGGSGGSCAAPWLATLPNATFTHPRPGDTRRDPITVSPGQTLPIYGHWCQTCQDNNGAPPTRPFTRLTVFVTQGHSRQAVASVSARNPNGKFAVTIQVPSRLQRGPAIVETSQPVEGPLFLQVR